MRKSVIYTRISTDETRQNIQRQGNDLKTWAERSDIEVVKTFEDSISGSVSAMERPAFQSMKLFIEQEGIDLILVTELSRLGRNTLNLLQEIERFKADRVQVYDQQTGAYLFNGEWGITPSYKVTLDIMASFAEFERSNMRERVNSGMRSAVKKGNHIGSYPIGYKRKKGQLFIDDKEAETVRKVYDLFLDLKRTTTTARYANVMGLKSREGQRLTSKSVKKILTLQIYTGKYTYKGVTIDVPTIISKDQFDQVQAILKGNSQHGKGQKHINPLANVKTVCGCCGRLFYQYRSGKAMRYLCKTEKLRYETGGDSCLAVAADQVNNIIADIALNAHGGEYVLATKTESIKLEIDATKQKLVEIENGITKAKKDIEAEKELFREGVSDIHETKAATERHKAKIERLNADTSLYNRKLVELHDTLRLFQNPVDATGSILSSVSSFKEFAENNIVSVEIERYGKENEVSKAFKKEIWGLDSSIVYRMKVVARMFTQTVYFTTRKLIYTTADPITFDTTAVKVYQIILSLTTKDGEPSEPESITPQLFTSDKLKLSPKFYVDTRWSKERLNQEISYMRDQQEQRKLKKQVVKDMEAKNKALREENSKLEAELKELGINQSGK